MSEFGKYDASHVLIQLYIYAIVLPTNML